METTGKVMMIQKKNRLKKIVLCAFVSAASVLTLCLILAPQRVAAATGANEKAALYRLATCYNRGVMKSPITIVSTASAGVTGATQFKGIGSLIQGTGTNAYQDVVFNSINNNGNATKSCREIITAAVDGSGKSTGGNETAKAAFLKGMGYQASTTKSQCATFTYNSTIGNRAQTARVCAEVENGKVKSGTVKVTNDANGDVLKLSNTAQMDGVELINDRCMNTSTWQLKDSCRVTVGSDMSFRSLVDAINAKIISENGQSVNVVGGTSYTFAGSKIDSSGTAMQIFTMSNTSTAARDAIKFLSGGEYSQASDIKLSIEEQKTILKDILTNFYGMSGNNLVCNVSDSVGSGMSGFVKISIDGKTCWGKPTRTDRVMAFSSDGTPDGTLKSFEQIVQMMNALDGKTDSHQSDIAECKERLEKKRDEYLKAANDGSANYSEELRQKYKDSAAEIDEKLQSNKYYSEQNGAIVCASYTDPTGNVVTPGEENNSSSSSSSDSENDLKECFDNASMLGWIFCPILKFVGSTLEDLYEKVEENFLVTDASKYTEGAEINQGWSKIRNFANIAFAIALLIVILSQVTGFGISNYGIKKMLPTLIVVIVLVNISFFLCQIAIDVSNIVGQGIKEIFDGLSGGGTFASIGDANLANLMGAVGIAGIGIGGVVAAFAGLGAMVPILLALISAIISVIFLLLLLSMRQAGIAVLVVLAPIAIICYALPNTKKLFDRWRSLFVSLLMIYPICAAVMGGTSFAATLIAVDGEVFTSVVAIILQVAPCFLIPSIVKSSMNVMGNLGSKVSQFGQKIGNTATGAIRKTDRVADFQERTAANAAGRRAGLFKIGQAIGMPATAGARRRAVRNFNRYRKKELGDIEAAYAAQGMTKESIQNSAESLKRKYDDQRIDDVANRILNGHGNYIDTDGKKVDIDQNNVESVGDAYARAVARASANPSDQRAFDEAAGLQRVLMMQKDKGLEQIEKGLKAQTHNEAGIAIGKNETTSALAAQMGRDGRWMGDVKTFDPGTFNYFNDLSNKSASLKDDIKYASTTAENFKPAKLPDLGDGAFNSIQKYASDQGQIDTQSAYEQAGNVSALWGAADSIEKAYSDPRIASQIKPDAKTLKLHNDIRRSAYNAKVRAYAQMQGKKASEVQQEFVNKFGAFHEARPGETIQKDTFNTANYLAHDINLHVPH